MHESFGNGIQYLGRSDSDLIETTLVEGSVALYNDTNSTSLPDKILVPVNRHCLISRVEVSKYVR